MTRRMRTDDLLDLAVPSQPALSPDGARLVYVLRTVDADADRAVHQLWAVPTAGGEPAPLTRGSDDTAPAWSPDGSQLAFVRGGDAPQVWLLPAGGGEARQLTDLPLGAGEPVWSPDGAQLAFAAPVDAAAPADEDRAARAARSAAPVVTDRLDNQVDGSGWLRDVRSQVHVVDVATGTCRQLTDGPEHVGRPAWSPDGTVVAFTAGVEPDSDLTLRAAVHVVDVTTPGARPQRVAMAEGHAGTVGWTADGTELLVVGWIGAPAGHARLLRVPLDGGDPVDLAGALDRNVMPGAPAYPGVLPQLVDDGRTVLFAIRDAGCSHLYAVAVDGGDPHPVLAGGGRVVSGLSVAGGHAVTALSTPSSFGEMVLVDLAGGGETVLTRHGDGLADVELFVREARTFTSDDGTEVQAWLVRDPERTGPRPLLLDVHGGPHNAWNGAADEVHAYHQELAARGWVVLLPNPRGSDGYGEAFYTGVTGGWGTADHRDLLAPVEQLVAEGTADPARLAVTGYSYGGFMTCWLTGHDDRFAAAVPGGVVSDLVSMAGTGVDNQALGMIELGGQFWEDPARWADQSPIHHVDRVSTPTLVLHGDADRVCPVGQAQQWFTSLRQRGVPAQLVVYPGAGHPFILDGRPSHRLDYNRRVVEWVERHAGRGRTGRAPAAPLDGARWQRRLERLVARHGVPGAQLGILRVHPDGRDEVVEAAHGVLSHRTGTPVTTDALFQIGSITKVWTATLAMQLVDEGLVDLDTPLVEVIDDLALGDPAVTKQVTMRHLLTHTSGIDGDIFTDTGRGDDCLESYVDQLADAAQNHPLGATWSYCNSGFTLLGRVIEVLTGSVWDTALRDRLLQPLGLTHTVTLPEEALLHASAVGHVDAAGVAQPAPVWMLPRALGPAGLVTAAARDVLAFARVHLTGGLAPDGTRVLSEDSTTRMQRWQADLPETLTLGDSWGLGWIRYGWDGQRLIGHDGATIGQLAFLRLLPAEGLAVTLLTNGSGGRDMAQTVFEEVFGELAGIDVPPRIAPPAEPVEVDVTPFLGTYERAGARLEVLADGEGGARMRNTVTGPLAELVDAEPEEHPMVPLGPDQFVVRVPDMQTWATVTFYDLDDGGSYLHFGGRATPKVRG